MAKLLVVVGLLFVAELAAVVISAGWAGWLIMLGQALLTGLAGVLAIRFMPTRWKSAMQTAWLWADPAYAAEYLGTDPAHIEQRLRADVRKAHWFLLGAILLIIPGLVSDLLGLLIFLWLAADCCWLHKGSTFHAI
jgi:UPF0716 family protein affecting phage T7 exclusion